MKLERIHQKNAVLEKILWICFLLCMVVQVVKQKELWLILILFFSGMFACGIISFLVRKKRFIEQTMYVCVLSMAAFTFILLYNEPVIVNLYLLFLVLFILTLYHDYRPVLLMAGLSLLIGVYSYSKGQELNYTYQEGDFFYYIFSLTVTLVVACLQIRFSREVSKQDEVEKRNIQEENELQTHTLIHSMPDLIYIKDAEGRFVTANEYTMEFFGVREEEFKMRTALEVAEENPAFSSYRPYFISDEDTWNLAQPHRFELTLPDPKGNEAIFDVIKVPTYHTDGRRKNLLVIGRNITEAKQANEYMLRSEKLNVVGELAAGVAHEIRNPLTSIKGFMQLFLAQGQYNDRYLHIMLDEISRIEMIINEYLSIAKPQNNGSLFAPESLQPVISNVVTLFTAQANAKNITVGLDLQEDCIVPCNVQEIKQVLINILQNAIEATPENGKIQVNLEKLPGSKQVKISIADSGCGISDERLNRLGEPFYSTKEKGTGLGLMTCFRIIEKHKGKLSFESEVGKGTSAAIVLSAAD